MHIKIVSQLYLLNFLISKFSNKNKKKEWQNSELTERNKGRGLLLIWSLW